MSNLRVRSWSSVLCGVCLLACASEPPPAPKSAPAAAAAPADKVLAPAPAPLKLLSAAEARPLELATVSVTSVDRLFTNGAALTAKAVPLPMDPASLRDMLIMQAGLSPEIATNLDLTSPVGSAIVATGAPGATGAVIAVAARGPAEAARVVGLLGRTIEKRGAAALVESGGGARDWILVDGGVIVFSDDAEALSRGARLAEEARRPGADDVTAVVFPEAIARANGTDVKSALAMLMAQLEAAQAAQGTGPLPGHQLDSFKEMLSLVGDAEAVELGLAIDPARGLSLRARLRARAGTRLEGVARDVHPYELDGTLLGASKTPPAFVGASSVGAFMRGQMAHQRERLAASKAKGAAAALAFHDATMAAIGGQTAFALAFVKGAPLFSGSVAYALKDAATASALAATLVKIDRDAALALLEAQVGAIPFLDWTVKAESVGKLKTLHYGLSIKKGSGLDEDVVKKVFGKGMDVYVAIAGTRMLATFGADAKGALGRLADAKPAAPTGALAESVAATKGRDSFFHFDVGSVLSLIASFVKDKKAEHIAKTAVGPIPVYGSAGGDGAGKIWSADFTVPPTAFVNAGVLVKAAMTAGAGGGGEKELAAPDKKAEKKKGEKKAKK
jgi:hypothetical protein